MDDMTYFAPTITASGLSIPTYSDIEQELVTQAQSIFGQDIYLGEDSQDYEMMAVFASMLNDTMQLAQAVYNSRGPSTAIGSGLDGIVSINGISRLAGNYSTAQETIVGTPNTVINNGILADQNSNQWALPPTVVIGSTGSITVTITCQTPGPITAQPNTITQIVTPVQGWTSATNAQAATPGTATETDSALRSRQAISTAQPSQSMLVGLEGALAALSGVSRFAVYENDTGSLDVNGNPPHSVTCVVDGDATPQSIAETVWAYKGPGSLANGTTVVPVTDQYNVTTNIGFYIPTYQQIGVIVTLSKLTGYTSSTESLIQSAVSVYLNNNPIGASVYNSSLVGTALSANPSLSSPTFTVQSVTAAIIPATLTAPIVSGTAYTSLSVSGLSTSIPSGTTLQIGITGTTQTVVTSAAAAVGDTTITVTSFTANVNYANGTQIMFVPSSSDVPIAFNQVSAGSVSNIIINS